MSARVGGRLRAGLLAAVAGGVLLAAGMLALSRVGTGAGVALVIAGVAALGAAFHALGSDAPREGGAGLGVVDAAHDAVVIADRNGVITGWNAAATAMFGWSREEAVGRTLTETVIPDRDHRAHLAGMMRFREGGSGSMLDRVSEVQARRRTGEIFPAEISLTATGEGEGVVLAAFVRDITDRRAAERALRASEERYRRLLETAGVVPWEAEPGAARVTYVGPQAEKLLGFPVADWLAEGFWTAHVHPEDLEYVLGQLGAVAAGAGSIEIEYRMLNRDGEIVWVRDLVGGEETASGPVLRGFRFDVTERRRLEEELLQSSKLEAVGRLAGGIAHDFNNTLTTILGFASLLESGATLGPAERTDLQEIRRAAAHAGDLTQQLLAFARRQVIRPRVIVLDDLVYRLDRMVARLIGEDVTVVTRPGADRAAVWVDPGRLEQALVNLVLNARDAMPRGGTLSLHTGVRDVDAARAAGEGVEAGRYATVSVSDTGIGMDRATLARIFEPFFTTKKEGKGTGLGLSMAYGVVRQAGGFLEVDSQPGKGATFLVHLPISAATARAEEVPPQPLPARTAGETILLAEDEPQVRALIERALLRAGYRVLLAQNGAEAIERSRAHPGKIDLLVTDVVMPVMGGMRAADTIRRERPGTRVLFVSGYSEESLFAEGVEENVHFMSKPFVPAELERKVREILDGATV